MRPHRASWDHIRTYKASLGLQMPCIENREPLLYQKASLYNYSCTGGFQAAPSSRSFGLSKDCYRYSCSCSYSCLCCRKGVTELRHEHEHATDKFCLLLLLLLLPRLHLQLQQLTLLGLVGLYEAQKALAAPTVRGLAEPYKDLLRTSRTLQGLHYKALQVLIVQKEALQGLIYKHL